MQSEAILESNLIKQLVSLGYESVKIHDGDAFVSNLKIQLEAFNKTRFTTKEFDAILNHLAKGNVFEKAKTLRDRFVLNKEDGTSFYVRFFDNEDWSKNKYQVTNQVQIQGSFLNRYDVTLLVNGLPLVQVELKRSGLEIKEAFNQINRYQRHSFWSNHGLFQYVQLFVISNGVNTKYLANNRLQSVKQTFYWADANNKNVTGLPEFAHAFLNVDHLGKMISHYVVLNETFKNMMILRPYQYFATEAIINQVKTGNENGYIWHTTGSGKTLTSFKASQIIMELPEVYKVVFVVDRKDLDYQTMQEFNSFKKGSVDVTDNTASLVEQLTDTTKLVLTTIQKLNNAITKHHYENKLGHLKDKKIVFIFDECHRSQFGETHGRVTQYFQKAQLFGFTGTPIFAENASKNELGKRTTKDLFGNCLHKYVITDAIRDQNVLRFGIEYVGKYKQAGEHDLRIATIFTYGANEEDEDAQDYLPGDDEEFSMAADPQVAYQSSHTRDKLESYIADYNKMYGTSFSTTDSQAFENYFKDISKRLKEREKETFNDEKDRLDILLVVSMFLTGFDAKKVNTLYVDKNLKHHGVIQSYSRTNRILGEQKSQGNILCFRNLKKATDEAITLFSNKDAIEDIILPPYEAIAKKFKEALKTLLTIVPTFQKVDDLESEEAELSFIQAFRALLRAKNVLESYTDFSWEDLGIDEQTFENYKSKYLDLYDKVKNREAKQKTSILEDIDFELELIHRDLINVAYIIKLLAKLKETKTTEAEQQKKAIMDLLGGDIALRSKRELIEKFIQENLPLIDNADNIQDEFENYWQEQKILALDKICKEEQLDKEQLKALIDAYIFSGQAPLRDDVLKCLGDRPSILKAREIGDRIILKMKEYVQVFVNGMIG